MMLTAAGLVHFGGAYDNNWIIIFGRFAIYKPLSTGTGFTTNHADRMQFINVICQAHQYRHTAKRFPTKILVQAGDNDS